MRTKISFAVLGCFLLLSSVPAFCQQCALCYTQAASSGARMIEALRSGIIILIVPPTLMTAGALALLRRRSHQFKPADGSYESDRW